MWCVAELDEAYIKNMEDVLAVYEKPYDSAEPVICIDEKPVSLHADVRPPSPAKPGKPAKQDNEYERRGTANIFGAVEPKAGRHFTAATPDRSGYQFACLVKRIVACYPQAKTIHVVMDNLNIHRCTSLITHFGEEKGGSLWDRLTVHYTPKHGSWLNVAECEFAILTRQCLSRRTPTVGELRRRVGAWENARNERLVEAKWRFTTADARIKLHRLYPSTR